MASAMTQHHAPSPSTAPESSAMAAAGLEQVMQTNYEHNSCILSYALACDSMTQVMNCTEDQHQSVWNVAQLLLFQSWCLSTDVYNGQRLVESLLAEYNCSLQANKGNHTAMAAATSVTSSPSCYFQSKPCRHRCHCYISCHASCQTSCHTRPDTALSYVNTFSCRHQPCLWCTCC